MERKKRGPVLLIHSLVFLLCLSLALPAPLFAASSNSPVEQQQKYQKAAKAADKAADTSELLMKVWAGVGAVCLAICIASMCGGSIISAGADNYICMGASLGAGITDAVMTKKAENAIAGIIGPAVSLATMGGGGGAAAAAGTTAAVAPGTTTAISGGGAAPGGPILTGQAPQLTAPESINPNSIGYNPPADSGSMINNPGRFDIAPSTPENPLNVYRPPPPDNLVDPSKFSLDTPASKMDSLQTYDVGKPDAGSAFKEVRTPDAAAKPTDAKPAAQKNWGACLSAVMATLQAFMKNKSAGDSRKTAKENRKNANELAANSGAGAYTFKTDGGTSSAATSSGGATTGAATGAATAAATASTGSSAVTSGAGSDAGTAAATAGFKPANFASSPSEESDTSFCDAEIASGNTKRQIECALRMDPTLPKAINSQGFIQDFERITKTNFFQYLNDRSFTVSKFMSHSLRPHMTAQQFRKFQILLKDLDKHFQSENPSHPGSSKQQPQLVKHSEFDAQSRSVAATGKPHLLPLNDLPAVSDESPLFSHLEKTYQEHSPDAIAEDAGLSLFDRVSYRYHTAYRRMLLVR